MLEQKASVVVNFKDELRRTTEHFNKVTEMQTIGQKEAEIAYKQRLFAIQQDFEERKRNTSEQYSHMIEQREADLAKFMAEAERYVKDKKAERKAARAEAVVLFDVAKRQRQTIEKVEGGHYDQGVKSYHIPNNDKAAGVTREEFPL